MADTPQAVEFEITRSLALSAFRSGTDDEPVIIDDGGSTRIRQITDIADDGPFLGRLTGTGRRTATAKSSFKKFKIVAMDADGDQLSFPAKRLKIGDQLVIESAASQTTIIDISLDSVDLVLKATITLQKASGGPQEPNCVQKPEPGNSRKRYVVENSGRILKIIFSRLRDDGGRDVTPILDVADYEDIIYTALYLRKT